MTVCSLHSYAGPRACPYCERDAALDRVAELERKLAEANATCVGISEYWRFQCAHRGEVIDHARALLQRWKNRRTQGLARALWRDTTSWLAANPAPLTSAPERKKDGL